MCVRCTRADAPWRLAAHVCDVCWAEAFAAQTAEDHAARAAAQRAERAEAAAAARAQLVGCGVRAEVTALMPDWVVLDLLDTAAATPARDVAAWTRVVVEPVGWLVAVREHAEQITARRHDGGTAGAVAPGQRWNTNTVAVAHAVMHHAGRVAEAGGRVLAWPGNPTLMAFTGLSRRRVQLALQTLVRAGFLRRVLTGGRVAGPRPGQPVHLAAVFELRVPLTAPELAEHAELVRALTPHPSHQGEHRNGPSSGGAVCTPPSSAGGFRGSVQLEYTGATRKTPALTNPAPRPPRPTQDQLRARYRGAAQQLQRRVGALSAVPVTLIEGQLRSWWERHHRREEVPPATWGDDLAAATGPWLPPWLVRRPVGMLHAKLAALDPAAPRPDPARTPPARQDRRRLDEQRALAEDIRRAQKAAVLVDRATRYEQIAQAAGWARTSPQAPRRGRRAGRPSGLGISAQPRPGRART